MAIRAPSHLDVITQYSNLFNVEGNLIGPPKTTWQLVAANQVLRSSPKFDVSIEPSEIKVTNEHAHGVLTCSLYRTSTGYQFGHGVTVEGDRPEKDVIEPHLVLNPQNDGVKLHYSSPPDQQNPDIFVYGVLDGPDGVKIPLGGSENELGAAVLVGGSGDIHLFKDGEVFAISVSPELLVESGQPSYIAPDNLLNLSRGGVYLVFVKGKVIDSSMDYSKFMPDLLRDYQGPSFDFDSNKFGAGGGLKNYSPSLPTSAAARAGYGERQGTSRNVKFEAQWKSALPVFFRLRVDRSMPPLFGTDEYVAWLRSKEQSGRKYTAITCNHCGNQAGPRIATLSDSHLQVHAGCSGCGAHSFSVTQYTRQNK